MAGVSTSHYQPQVFEISRSSRSGAQDYSSPVDDALPEIAANYRTMQEMVFIALRDEILSGRLRPTERLNTSQISERLGVSRMPVREAMQRLVAIGLVENIPHRGAFVKELSVEEVIEIYYIRAALEGIAARLAARTLTAEELTQLSEMCSEMQELANAGDDGRFLELNQAFHGLIQGAAHYVRLESLIQQYYHCSEQYRSLGMHLPGRLQEILEEHRNLVLALADRDPVRAEYCVREHHLNTARRIVDFVGSGIEI